ncbi:MAG: hypothetical protein OXC54_08010 [Rhodospirillaceae bacterium]|nr:hypothetical protein [Rhodospirillaceae bacterium]
MSLSFLPAVRRFPLFLPSAKLAAVALVTMLTLPTDARAQMATVSIVATGTSFELIKEAPTVRLVSTSMIPANTRVRILVSVQSGYRSYFRNHGSPALLSGDSSLADFKSNVITLQTRQAGTSVNIERDISFPNDRIDSGPVGESDTVIQVVLLSVDGFVVDRNAASANFPIIDRDDCTNPAETQYGDNGGIVYRPGPGGSLASGLCVCTTKSTVVLGGMASGETESYATTALKWRTDSTKYCPESPYQRP